MNAKIAEYTYRSVQYFRGEPVMMALKELERSQWYPKQKLDDLQFMRLRSLLVYCYENIIFYRKRFVSSGLNPYKISSVDDIKKIPVLTKKDMQENKDLMTVKKTKRRKTLATTSGSSGIPLCLWRDNLSYAYDHANIYRGHKWHGVNIAEPYALLWGQPCHWKPLLKAKLKDFMFNRIRCSAFKITEDYIQQFLTGLTKFKPKYINAYPSALYDLSLFLEQMNIDARRFRISKIFTTAEILLHHQKQLAEKVFGCRVVDTYGCAEVGQIAHECEMGEMHVPIESIVVEIKGCSSTDGNGEVIVTDLHNYVMPIIRYKLGDIVSLKPDKECSCGRQLPIMDKVLGRTSDPIILPNGRKISPLVPYYIFKLITSENALKQYQFVYKKSEGLILKMVKTNNFKDKHLVQIKDKISKLFGNDIYCKYEFVPFIEKSPSGKSKDYIVV